MIKIVPYFELPNKKDILAYYLNLVADVVPFLPEDVLEGIDEAPDSISHTPRNRTDEYKQLLDDFCISHGNTKEDKRIRDAELAKVIVKNYSTTLYNALYANPTNQKMVGAVNRPFLRDLLTTRFSNGKIPDKLIFSDKKEGMAAKLLQDHVFRYDVFSQKKGSGCHLRSVHTLLSMLGVEICPYCNRQFTSTIDYGDQLVRSQIDHFKNKKDYPYLSLSINNLVPCCSLCNLLKHDRDLDILYPYEEGIGDSYFFEAKCDNNNITSLLTGSSDATQRFELAFSKREDVPDSSYKKRAETSVKAFALRELYQSHKGYVADLFFQRYIFTDELLSDIKDQFPTLFKSEDEIKRILLLMDYSPASWGKRTLEKLTHDITRQIDTLYTKKESQES